MAESETTKDVVAGWIGGAGQSVSLSHLFSYFLSQFFHFSFAI